MKTIRTITTLLLALAAAALLASQPARAADADRLEQVATQRGVSYSNWFMPTANAKGTVVLFPGGGGGFGYSQELNEPRSRNFLVRSREFFRSAGYNVLIVGKPQDREELDYGYRISKEHMSDVRSVLERARRLSGSLPVWLVGTSRGTISATAAAINNPDLVQGVVLTASVVNYRKAGAIPSQDLDRIRVPLLVVHHSNDQCVHCAPSQVSSILSGAKNSPRKQLIMLTGGEDQAVGNPCEGQHTHGFIGIEQQTVKTITDWIDASISAAK